MTMAYWPQDQPLSWGQWCQDSAGNGWITPTPSWITSLSSITCTYSTTTTTTTTATMPASFTPAEFDWTTRAVPTDSFGFSSGGIPAAQDIEAQREARRQQNAETIRQADEHRARQRAAHARAMEVLEACLSPGQFASYRDQGFFYVTSSTGRRWRIRSDGYQGNVDLMPDTGDQAESTWCAHPPGGLPAPDCHLAQALALSADEGQFTAVAHRMSTYMPWRYR